MSITIDSIIEGVADPILAQLTNRAFDSTDDPASFDATGKTITLELCGSDGVAVDTTGKVAWSDALTSIAVFNRLADDLSATLSPYRARWFVDGVYPYPSTRLPDFWIVVKAT